MAKELGGDTWMSKWLLNSFINTIDYRFNNLQCICFYGLINP